MLSIISILALIAGFVIGYVIRGLNKNTITFIRTKNEFHIEYDFSDEELKKYIKVLNQHLNCQDN